MTCHICLNKNRETSEMLNRECVCSTMAVESSLGKFSSHSPVFLSRKVVDNMEHGIRALEKVIRSDAFKKTVITGDLPQQSKDVNGGILASYDFHLDGEMPKLIEINTNAGGFFLQYELLKSSPECCSFTKGQNIDGIEGNIVDMFRNEFKKISDKPLTVVAIIDETPSDQFLYPDFLICKEVLEKHGITVLILDGEEVEVRDTVAYGNGVRIDLIYNRLTDFYFEEEKNRKFLSLLEGKETAVSPSPSDHKLFADKINFIHLQNEELLAGSGSSEEVDVLKNIIPRTILVTPENESELWKESKKYFFKPLNGYGGKGAYNGKGLTKKVWEHITSHTYIAQEIVTPSTKVKQVEDVKELFKFDIRAYVYDGEVLFLGARVYQGQTTNFRTPGGGFAPIFITEN